jgi:putative transposase
MKITRCLKIRLYPTEDQKVLFAKTFGCRRFVYNKYVEQREQFYNENIKNKNLSDKEKKSIYKLFTYKTEKQLKDEFPFLKEVPSTALQQARGDAEEAYSQFFKGKKGKPHFQKKNGWQSFRLTMLTAKPLCEHKQTITLPVIKEVTFRNGRIPKWFKQKGVKYQNITVSKTSSNKYFASICCIYDSAEKEKSYSGSDNQAIGLDFSPKHCYIDSNNNKAPNYIPVKQRLCRKIAHLQRELARRGIKRDSNNKPIHDKDRKLVIVGSKNREKTRLKLAKLEEHIANKRRDYIEKETLRLVCNYQIIGLETLNIKGLMRKTNKDGKRIKHRNARNYVDVSWNKFDTTLTWKSRFHNCFVVNADRWFASSQLCNGCGFKFSGTKNLSCREWICPECGEVHNRDCNAALNLRNNAIQCYSEFRSGIVGTTRTDGDKQIIPIYACGEIGNRKVETSVKQEEIAARLSKNPTRL